VMISFHGARKKTPNLTQNTYMVREVGDETHSWLTMQFQFCTVKEINADNEMKMLWGGGGFILFILQKVPKNKYVTF
jgi:hypothetical protein